MNILTAREFIAQGTSAAAIMSIARSLESGNYQHRPQKELAAAVRSVANEVADIMGVDLYGKRRRFANDNRQVRSAARNKRAA
ncbi:hypothetical protein [Pseudaminobacter sp. NGMCC 1.201702]|uniref:hypothetical protein n=1 Tax=Pseudaminobacter sp. NGMCC 1.201702 TaxID=3391825 RepID=UPI0039F144D8